MATTVTGHLRDRSDAQPVVDDLERIGFTKDSITYAGETSIVAACDSEEHANRAIAVLKAHGAEITPASHRETGGEFDPEDPHSDAPNYGDEGGSSQWSNTVLRADRD